MMEQRAAHPLDIDLLAYAQGDFDAAFADEVDRHLSECLLCRIHLNRIRRGGLDLGPDLVPTLGYPEIAADVLSIIDGRSQPPSAFEPGQLWLAGLPQRMLVWIEAVNEAAGMATVLAATLDVDAADHTSLIVDVPRLGREVAIFASVPGWISLERLHSFVDHADVVDDIAELQSSIEEPSSSAVASGAGDLAVATTERPGEARSSLRVGARISGGFDERLEFRQVLADQLAELDPEDGDGADGDDGPTRDHLQFDSIVAHMREELTEDLSSKRFACEVRHIDEDFLVGSYVRSLPVLPVATIHELDCTMLVVASQSTHDGLGFDPEDAYKLLLDSGAASLAVAELAEPFFTRLFVRSVLRPAFELPVAVERHRPRPLWKSRPLVQAVIDYLQGDVFPIEPEPVPLARSHPDIAEFVPARALGAIDELKQIRAQKGKNRALKRLGSEEATALNEAIASSPDVDALLRRIEEITLR